MVTHKPKRPDAVFKAIADPTRRQILGMLRAAARRPGGGEGQTVGRIAACFRISRPAISKHLRLLRSAGLVVTHKRGTAHFCELNAAPLRQVNDWLHDYESFWTGNLRNLKHFIEENP